MVPVWAVAAVSAFLPVGLGINLLAALPFTALFGRAAAGFFVGEGPPSFAALAAYFYSPAFLSSSVLLNLTDFPTALPALCRKLDFYLVELAVADLFSLAPLTAARSLFMLGSWTAATAMADSGKATQAYSANQSAALGGLNLIYLGKVMAVKA